jgi:hypothetical protein
MCLYASINIHIVYINNHIYIADVSTAAISKEEPVSLWKEYMSLETAKNAIKVVGAPVDTV